MNDQNQIIEIRARLRGDRIPWLDITPWACECMPGQEDAEAQRYGAVKEQATGQLVVETRWNHLGSLQGHYVPISGEPADFPSTRIVKIK